MMFGGLKPWQNPRQRALLRACFHVDSTKALGLCKRWFAAYELDDVTYPEHRVLVRLLGRFPDIELAKTTASRIAGLRRQLWVRANLNLKTVKPALDMLDEFGIPWVLTGAAHWFVQGGGLAHEAMDMVDIIVPEKAHSTALHLLAQSNWRSEYATPDVAAGPNFARFSKGHGALKLSKAAPLFSNAPELLENLWRNSTLQNHELGQFYLPDAAAALGMALGKAHPKYAPDDQWVFDLFNLSPEPKSLVLSSTAPALAKRRIARALHTCFYT